MNGFAIHVSAAMSFREVSARYQTQASEIRVFSMTYAASGQYSAGEGELVGALADAFLFRNCQWEKNDLRGVWPGGLPI
jgi:hypothetical protein